MSLRRIALTMIVIAVVLIAGWFAADLLVDWLWFSSVGYIEVFLTLFGAKIALFIVVFAASAIILWLNGALAHRASIRQARPSPPAGPWGSYDQTLAAALQRVSPHLPWGALIAGGAMVIAALIAWGELSSWDIALRFIWQAPYGRTDPLYEKDIGFYLFSLPAYTAIKNWMLVVLVLSALFAGAIYFAQGNLTFDRHSPATEWVIAHGSALLGAFFAVKAWSYWLDRYLLLYGDNGVVVGAAYTDVQVELPVLWLLIALALAAAFASLANIRMRSYRLPAISAGVVFGASFVLGSTVPALFQRFYVKPNELQLERPYLERNIALTQEAYDLRSVTVKPFPAEQGLTLQTLKENRPTIDNVRLWDWQPLIDTYAQLQEIRTYYKFIDVDVDRYELQGSQKQVMLSARELETKKLPPNTQTWVNKHLLFTHGNGAVMSPVTEKTTEGLPLFYLRDIPPVVSGGPALSEPRIYFGEGVESYVIVKGTIKEFDYPKGNDNAYTAYGGKAGVPLGGLALRSLFAWYFNDPNILLTRYTTDESRILFRRNITDRVRAIAPFLRLDHDPYAVISNGRIFWFQDAYTTSSWFPYSQQIPRERLNYIRNSVKIVIDAYNGTVEFYVADPKDSVITTYSAIFTSLFKPLSAMPPDLQKHIRYPEDFFYIQAEMYRAYHMNEPEVFYNREDLWQFPRRPTGINGEEMEPYYINMRLPGEQRTEFFIMLPMVPSQRQNMIAWLAGRCDPPDYGKLVVYEFPKEKLVYGPFQIEARINQNTEISQQISLWNQMGSRVIRGNLLVIPIANSILYVSPLYLRAESGQVPELKRVIAAYGDRVVMEDTLAGALAALFKETPSVSVTPEVSGAGANLAREALSHYDRAIERLKAGDWAGFGAELDAIRPFLQQLSQPSQARQ
jgi:uncharacterized membrane protein (UPF0182 family)